MKRAVMAVVLAAVAPAPFPGVADTRQRADLIAYLKTVK